MFCKLAVIIKRYNSGIPVAELRNRLESRIHASASELLGAYTAQAADMGGGDEIVESNQGILKVPADLSPRRARNK